MSARRGPARADGADWAPRLAELAGPENVRLADHERDGLDGAIPAAVVAPRTAEEVARVLAFAAERGLAAGVLGGGTRLALGNPPARLDLLVSTRALTGIVEYEPADFVVTARAGITLDTLQSELSRSGQRFSLDPPSRGNSTLGGALSADASGPHRFLHGAARDLAIGIEAALPDGSVVRSGGRVVKNVAGYDFRKLFIGAIGTLGVITAATLKLHAPPETERLVAAFFAGWRGAGACAGAILRAGLDLAALDLVNREALRVLVPDAPARAACALLLCIHGPARSCEAQADEAAGACERLSALGTLIASDDAARETWARARALLAPEPHGESALAFRAGVPIGQVAGMAARIEEALPGTAFRLVARAGNGVVHARLETAEAAPDLDAHARTLLALRREAHALGGSLVLEEAPLPLKSRVEAWGAPEATVALSRRVKAAFDPSGTMAPGRFVGGL
jgi:glycolate oxidase FAD binding subunit